MASKRVPILFVDDEPLLLGGLKRNLIKKAHVWDMHFVTSGQEALDLLEKTPFQVVVTDLMMPGMTGTELIKTINQNYPNTYCMMLTGTADLNDAANLINTTNIFRFYNKPCQAKLIIKGISEAISHTTAEYELPSLEQLTVLFDLTPSESRLAQTLVQGRSLEEAANEINITLSSSRTYLERIFVKTKTNGQAELVSKILRHCSS